MGGGFKINGRLEDFKNIIYFLLGSSLADKDTRRLCPKWILWKKGFNPWGILVKPTISFPQDIAKIFIQRPNIATG